MHTRRQDSRKRLSPSSTSKRERLEPLSAQFLLRSGTVHLNHGCYGACPHPVVQACQQWQLTIEHHPREFHECLCELFSKARQKLGGYVNCAADDLVFVTNSTTGLNSAIWSLPLQPGDQILASDHEFAALDSTWQAVCERTGAVYRRHPIRLPISDAASFVEDFWSSVGPRTRVIFISHIASPTGLIFPIDEIVRRARRDGIISIVDGAHALGQIRLDLRSLDPDVYVSSAHKWLCAPKGSAFLYVRKEMQPSMRPLVVASRPPFRTGSSSWIQQNQWQGTRDLSPFLATLDAIDFQIKHRWDEVRRRCHILSRRARAEASIITGLDPLSPDSHEWYSQMAGIPLPKCNVWTVEARLRSEFGIEVGAFLLNKQPLLRVSFQAYNNERDLQIFLGALRKVLKGECAGIVVP